MWAKSKFRIQRALLFSVICCFLLLSQGFAKVLRVEVKSRQPVLDGKVYGQFGDYELVNGTIYFGFDPANPMNARIIDNHTGSPEFCWPRGSMGQFCCPQARR